MTKKTLVTVVTANRYMAETIARAIGATSEHEGYYHGKGYAVTWTNGEIIDTESSENNTTDDNSDVELNIVKGQTLHNMVTLWMDATVELGYEFEPTFLIAHKLYAKGLISYPYLYQNGIPGNVYDSMRRDFRVLEHNARYGRMAKEVGWLSTRNTFHNGETSYNGHGIVTTGLHPTDLSRDEERLYNLIVKRVIEAFTPDDDDFQKKARKKRKSHKKAG